MRQLSPLRGRLKGGLGHFVAGRSAPLTPQDKELRSNMVGKAMGACAAASVSRDMQRHAKSTHSFFRRATVQEGYRLSSLRHRFPVSRDGDSGLPADPTPSVRLSFSDE